LYLLDPQVGPSFTSGDDSLVNHMGRQRESVFLGVSIRVKPAISIIKTTDKGAVPLELHWVDGIKNFDQAVHPFLIILTILPTPQDQGADTGKIDGISSVGFTNM
jgi:hypothetical protein